MITKAYTFDALSDLFPNDTIIKSEPDQITTKINTMYNYRTKNLEPLSKIKKIYDVSSDCENTNPIHRLIIKKEFNEFIELIKVEKTKFCTVFSYMYEQISKYNEHSEDMNLDEIHLQSMIVEYLEWSILLASLRYTQADDVKYIYYDLVIGNFCKVIDIAKLRRGLQNEIKKRIELFVKITLINLNDEIFYREVLCQEEYKVEQNKEEEDGDNLGKIDLSSIKQFFSNRNFGSSSRDQFIELEEERDVNRYANKDGYSMMNAYLESKFSFEDDPMMLNLMHALFAYKKENSDTSPEMERWEIYDWLINENDYYIENLKSFFESTQNCVNEDIRELMVPASMVNTNHFFSSIKIFETLMKNFDQIDNLKQLELSIDETFLFENIQKSVTEAKEILINSFQDNDDRIDRRMSQLLLYKLGCFDGLFSIYSIFCTNKKLQNQIGIEEIEKVLITIYEIFSLITEDNIMIISLFFTRESISLFFDIPDERPSLRMIKENFYLQCLKTASKYKYKLNLTIYINKIVKTYNEIQNSINRDVENILSNRLKEFIVIIKSLIKCLKLSTEKSKNQSNEVIQSFIKDLLKSNLYNSLWSNYKMCFNEKTIEKLKSNPEEKDFILIIIKLLNNIDDYYFYLLCDVIPVFEIRDLLEENINEMAPNHRRLLSMTYAKYYVISPFNILPMIDNANMELMCDYPDNNLNGKTILSKEEAEQREAKPNKKEQQQTSSGNKPGFFGGILKKGGGFVKKGNKVIGQKKNLFNTSAGATSFLNVLKVGEQSLGLEPIYSNLSKYKRHMKLYMKTYFKANPKMFIKYFEDVILYPSTFSVYKILYFSPVLNAKSKYLAYKTIYLFLECLNFFIETCLFDPEKFGYDEEFRNLLNNFFVNEKPNQDISDVLRGIKDKLMIDVAKIGKDPKFEPLKTQNLLDYYIKYIKQIKPLSFLQLEKGKFASKINQSINQSDLASSHNMNDTFEKKKKKKIDPKETKLKEFNTKLSDFLNFYSEHKENLSENVLVHLFETPTPDEDTKTEDLKRTIILDLLFRVDFSKKEDELYPSNKTNLYTLVNCINKVYKADPDLWHDVIADISFHTKAIMDDIIKYQLTFLFQFIYIDFHRLDKKDTTNQKDSEAMTSFLILIEYLRLHCENHHKTFQTIMFNANIIKSSNVNGLRKRRLDLVNFMLKIPVLAKKNISYYKEKADIISIFKASNFNYFNTLITGVTDFLIEIIQGAFPANMQKMSLGKYTQAQIDKYEKKIEEGDDSNDESDSYPNLDFDNYIEIGYVCFDELDTEESEFFLAHFFRFVTCFFEESLNPRENKEKIVKKFNPKKLLLGLAHSTSNLYLHFKENKLLTNDYQLPETFSEELVDLYLKEDEFMENYFFMLSSNIFRFFKMASQWKSGETLGQYLNDLRRDVEENSKIGEKNRNFIIGKREAYKFYSKIIKEVEIFYKPKETLSELERKKYKRFFKNNEAFQDNEDSFKEVAENPGSVQRVVYLVNPDSLFGKDQDMTTFTDSVPLDETDRLSFLIKYIPQIETDILMRKTLYEKESKVQSLLYQVNYLYANYISIIFAVAVNVLILFSSFYEYIIINPYESNYEQVYDPAAVPEDKYILEIIPTRKELNSNYIFLVGVIHLIFIVIVMINWVYFTLMKLEVSKTKNKFTIFSIIPMIAESEIAPLGWNFITGIIAILNIKFHFIFSLQLFTVFTLFETMQTVIYSVRIRYMQFLSVGLLMMIFSLFFANVKFYWFTNEESGECLTFNQCFLSIVTDGIRAGGGMGFPMKRITDPHYYSEFIFEWVFYFVIVLVFLNAINGIIVDTFQSLREEANELYEIKMNICFICSLKRGIFERIGLDFEAHKEREHNILNYFHYLLKILNTDEQELNSLDYQVLLSFRQTRTDFFPMKTSLSIDSMGSIEEEEE